MTLIISFLAGALTVLAPCILPLLPIIIGGSLYGEKEVAWKRTIVIISSLALSVFIFSLLLRGTTLLLGVPQEFWQVISGGIIILLGLHFLFPGVWTHFVGRFRLQESTDKTLGSAAKRTGFTGAVLTGAALGPVFTSCSPTYALILAAILPVSFALGVVYLAAYTLGMALVLLLVAYFGIRFTRRVSWLVDERSIVRKIIGLIFIIVGLSIIMGWDKDLQSWLLSSGAYDGTSGLEVYLIR